MATNRFGYSDDFVLKNKKVGINTSEPQEELEVVGDIKSYNLRVTGDSSLTTFEGFLSSNQNVDETLNVSTSTSSSLSGEIIIGDGVTATIEDEVTSSQGNIDSLKVYNTFTIPTGGTEDRPRKVKPGQLYYNVDFKTIEFWDGNVWRQVDNTTRSGRGVFGGGTPGPLNSSTYTIDFVNINTQGNAQNFGNLTVARFNIAGTGNETRGIFVGGANPAPTGYFNVIDYITIASEGNAINFGDLSEGSTLRAYMSACASSTRGIFAGGYQGVPSPSTLAVDHIEYIEISTIGDAKDFGDLNTARYTAGACSSPVRGIIAGGAGTSNLSSMEFITIASKGNGKEFGNLTSIRANMSNGCSNSNRGIFSGGQTPTILNSIDYVTISSLGNAQDFGDLTQARQRPTSASNQTRAVIAGGGNPSAVNTIDFIFINTTGNAQDFGDLTEATSTKGACSDSHGGLGGF